MDTLVTYQEKGHGIITLNRPEKHHAISIAMANQLKSLLDQIKQREIPFLVIESTGDRSFCSGGDLHDLHGSLTEDEAYEALAVMKTVLMELVTFPVPTICFLQGNAYGGGCEIATACDFRIAKERTSFGFVQTNLGILPGWGGGAILYEKVPPSFAFHWLLEGKVYDADFLQEKGWLHEVIPVSEWGYKEKVLESYSMKSIEQMSYLKSQYLESLNITDLFEKMEKESRRCAQLWESEEHQRLVQQFLNR